MTRLPTADRWFERTTMDRLLGMPVTVVHAGHDPSFDRERLCELARAYLRRRRG